ncbi:undecaprenyl-diphosphatase [Halococcus sp. IIIV-5B]|nr:undecaprenyl-diphosphatase [Halococcus sp. IIIV-5B]
MTVLGRHLLQFYANHGGTPLLNEVMVFVAENLVYLIPIALLYLWFTSGEEQPDSSFRMALVPAWFTAEDGKSKSVFIFFTIVVSLIISYGMGQLYAHPAPYVISQQTLLGGVPENSFPSQHTTVMFAFAWPLFYLQGRWRDGLIAVVLASLVGVSRVYVGVHYPIDIVGAVGASLLGFVLVYVARGPVMTFADQCVRIEEYVSGVVT